MTNTQKSTIPTRIEPEMGQLGPRFEQRIKMTNTQIINYSPQNRARHGPTWPQICTNVGLHLKIRRARVIIRKKLEKHSKNSNNDSSSRSTEIKQNDKNNT